MRRERRNEGPRARNEANAAMAVDRAPVDVGAGGVVRGAGGGGREGGGAGREGGSCWGGGRGVCGVEAGHRLAYRYRLLLRLPPPPLADRRRPAGHRGEDAPAGGVRRALR